MCWVNLKHGSSSRNSEAGLLSVLSICRLKLPRRRTDGEMADNWVRKSVKSERKRGMWFGGGDK